MENPPSIRNRILVGMATVIALAVLYVLSAGPADCVGYAFPKSEPLVKKLYTPLYLALEGTPLAKPFWAYDEWRMARAFDWGTN